MNLNTIYILYPSASFHIMYHTPGSGPPNNLLKMFQLSTEKEKKIENYILCQRHKHSSKDKNVKNSTTTIIKNIILFVYFLLLLLC